MPAKSVVMAIVLSGWLIAAVFAALIVAYTSFFGVAVIGLMIWFVCARVELEEDGPVGNVSTVSLFASQLGRETRCRANSAPLCVTSSLWR